MQGASEDVRDAASVILLREGEGDVEVLLAKRRARASFMASAWVFPGGALDEDERDSRAAALRELFEEAGILLARGAGAAGEPQGETADLRQRVLAGESFSALLAERGLVPDLSSLHYFAHWITPSAERKRFSAKFFVATLPAGQKVDTSAGELDDARWLAPREALERAGELRLPPPQLRTLRDLSELAAAGGIAEIREACARRAAHPQPILPRAAPYAGGFALLLPWDPEYNSLGTGEALAIPRGHPLAEGPSRFILEDSTWRHVDAPSSPNAV